MLAAKLELDKDGDIKGVEFVDTRLARTTPWQLLNGFVSAWTNQISSTALTVKAQWAYSIPLLSTQLELNIIPKDGGRGS